MTKRLAGRKNKLKGRMRPAGRTLASPALIQGAQTQSDLRAAWDAKKGLAGRIEIFFLTLS